MKSENQSYLLINPFDKTVTPVYYDGELSSLYALLGCTTVDCVCCGRYDLFVDDEGLFKPDQKFFAVFDYPHQPLAGMALAVGTDEEGCTVPANITLEELDARVLWIDGIEWEDDNVELEDD